MVNSRRGAAAATAAAKTAASDMEVGFAKLQGEGFEYYMQTYSITLGRLSRKKQQPEDDDVAGVDVDLGGLGGGPAVSRRHARIFYDFAGRRFALEVLGKNGCMVEGVFYGPREPPVKLKSQDLIQMGDAQFYFLLPSRSVFDVGAPAATRALPRPPPAEEEEAEEGEGVGKASTAAAKRARKDDVKKSEMRSRAYREADNQKLLLLEEKDVISSVSSVLSNLCEPGDRMPMNKLHEVMFENYGNIWHHNRVRKYLTSEDWPESEADGKAWYGLLTLLRKYPECFVINIRKGAPQKNMEFVSLASQLP